MSEPPQLAARPHWGVLPIPWIVHVDGAGRPDFRVHEDPRRYEVAVFGLCQLCGLPLDEVCVLAGLAASVDRRSFGEPPMHEDCFEYAWSVCPWLAGGAYSDRGYPVGSEVVSHPEGAERLGVLWSRGFRTAPDEERGHGLKYVPAEIVKIEWRTRGVTT